MLGVKIGGIILLCLAQFLNARPGTLGRKTGNHFHLTDLGDISVQDISRLAADPTPDSGETINPEQIDDPYENNIEAETLEYSKSVPNSDDPYLTTPRDQEQNFVNLLKKQYKGTFPEYGKETKSDFAKNKELEDNLSEQPETVYFGHSDDYKEKSGKSRGLSDIAVQDDSESTIDNLAAFDEDSNILNSLEGKTPKGTANPHSKSDGLDTESFLDKLISTTKSPSHSIVKPDITQGFDDILRGYDGYGDTSTDDVGQPGTENPTTTEENEGHSRLSEKDDRGNENMDGYSVTEKPGMKNKHVTDHVTGRVTDHMTDDVTDDMEDHVTGHATDYMIDHVADAINDHMTEDVTDDVTDHHAWMTTDDHATDHVTEGKDDHVKEIKKLNEKTEEEALWDENEKLRQQLAEALKDKQKKQSAKKKKEKLKHKVQSEGILKDFDELKKHNNKTSEKHDKPKGDVEVKGKNNAKTKAVQQSSNASNSNKDGRHIKYVHAEDQVTGDAILDFLDKLLEKDPKQLKHDVLAMTKEIQNEGNPSPSAPEKSTKAADDSESASNSESSNTMNEEPVMITESPTSGEDAHNWFVQLENNMNDKKHEKETQNEGKEEMSEDFYSNGNDHDAKLELYPDDGQRTSKEQQESDKTHKAKEEKTSKDIKEKKQDKFDYEEFKEEALKMHNEYRHRHNAVAFAWSDLLAKKATATANKLLDATRNTFARELKKQGENLAILPYSTENIAKKAVDKWYAEITKFSFTKPSVKADTRDFTQIIWNDSKEFGMGFAHTADKKKTLVVALYSPAGNDKNKLKENLNIVHDDPYADIRRSVLARKLQTL